jgi:hypothetical protein
MYNDAITVRALAALGEDSSDESDMGPSESTANHLQLLSGEVPLENSNVEPRDSDRVESKPPPAAEPAQQYNLKREQEQNKLEIKTEPEMKAASKLQDQESNDVIDLTLSDDEDEKGNPTAFAKQGYNTQSAAEGTVSGNTNNSAPEPSARQNQKKRGNGLMILEEFRVFKQVPAAQRLPFLSGKLTVSKNNAGTYQLLLRGVWGYQKKPDFIPQRFELVSDVMLDHLGSKGLPSTCTFHGSFVYHNNAFEEKYVTISFHADESESAPIVVKGSGTNEFGRFELNGTAERLNESDGVVYSLMLTKIYDKSCQPTNEKPRGRKRKSSEVDSTDESKRHFKSSTSIDSDASFSLHSHPGPKSSGSPPLLTDEHVEDSNVQVKAAENRVTHQRAILFDQVITPRTAQRRNAQSLETKSPISKRMLGFAAQQQPMAAANVNKELSGNTARTQAWHEFGSLSNSLPMKASPFRTHTNHYMSWTIKDVARPSFAKITIDFW